MENYKFTQTWFLDSELKNILLRYINPYNDLKILEIGCFEGLSSVFFADNLLNHKNSTLTCVDPFLSINNNDHGIYLQNNEELSFDYNIKICKNSEKISIFKTTSDDFFKFNNKFYDFIYIDGCHEPEFIERDLKNSFNCLSPGGIIWMDDYNGKPEIRSTIDKFFESYAKGYFIVIYQGYQLAIRKIV